MSIDIARIRAHFPGLAEGTAHFDGPGGSQVPDVVGAAMADAITSSISNRGSVTAAEKRADAIVRATRAAVADLLGAPAGGVVFGRSATQLCYDFSRTLAKSWSARDEVVVTRLDHDSNIRPWIQAAEHAGATIRWVDFDKVTGELEPQDVAAVLSANTALVAITGASNLLGTRPDIPAIAQLVHEAGALLYVDGVHLTPHASVDFEALGADIFTCSPYKFLGPHCAVLAADPQLLDKLEPDKLLSSSNEVPERFEFGTLPYELMAGTTAAIDFLAGLDEAASGSRRERLVASMNALEEHEDALFNQLEGRLGAVPGVHLYGQAAHRTPTMLLSVDGRDSAELYRFLATKGVNAPAGSFYALEASRWLGLGDAGALRVGLAPYSNQDDIDRLVTGITEFAKS
ncbi:MAG: cysteine desulfurase-like protein [Antricoccus sp.]